MSTLFLLALGSVLRTVLAQDTLPSQQSVTDYAPSVNVECPDFSTTSLIRVFSPQNQSLHPEEAAYVSSRQNTTIKAAWNDWLGDGSALGYNVSVFQQVFPKVGMAIPGGGLRAAQYGAACLNGLDARNGSAKAAGTGGLLQVASYLTGLSGGSWVTGSLFFNNWPTIPELVFGNGTLDGWKLDLPLVSPDGDDVFSTDNQYFYGSILWSVISKANTGIDTSITDPWARMISYHFLNQSSRQDFFTNSTAHGAGQLWSDIPQIPAFQQKLTPFPLIVADSRPANSNSTTALSPDPIVYEISPFEIASYDPNLSAGMNLTYAGTHLTNGKADNGSACVTGFDQAGFIMGSSASLFNQIFDFAHNTLQGFNSFGSSDSNTLVYVLQRQLRSPDTFEDSAATWLQLIDGSSNGENVPYGPLFVRSRELDVIVTIEGSADDPNNWPNGTGPLATQSRLSTLLLSSHQQFPPIPQTAADWIATGVRQRATFFGCNPQTPGEYPMVIYLPNAPPINGDNPVANTATFDLSYPTEHTQIFFNQVFTNTISGFTPNANTPDPNFGKCLQCAAIDRARSKVTPTVDRSSICSQCFDQYCYDPANPPSQSELPNRKLIFVDPTPEGLSKIEGFLGDNKFKLVGAVIGLIAFIALLCGGLFWWKKRRDKQMQYTQVRNFHDDDTEGLARKSMNRYQLSDDAVPS
ncbi:phospholipase B [Roridomyces roridus]|uniref:Lysophospholipase n=1 Tax=Roridomyces roridus TaxID=1738132 RepID=A0AAD7G045_9AGAR|nr:phospholipase B [Roridomyces roridus]